MTRSDNHLMRRYLLLMFELIFKIYGLIWGHCHRHHTTTLCTTCNGISKFFSLISCDENVLFNDVTFNLKFPYLLSNTSRTYFRSTFVLLQTSSFPFKFLKQLLEVYIPTNINSRTKQNKSILCKNSFKLKQTRNNVAASTSGRNIPSEIDPDFSIYLNYVKSMVCTSSLV